MRQKGRKIGELFLCLKGIYFYQLKTPKADKVIKTERKSKDSILHSASSMGQFTLGSLSMPIIALFKSRSTPFLLFEHSQIITIIKTTSIKPGRQFRCSHPPHIRR